MANFPENEADDKPLNLALVFVSGDEDVEHLARNAFPERSWGSARVFASLTKALTERQVDTAIVVIIDPPLLWLTSRIKHGVPPRMALAEWRDVTAPILKECRIARRHIALVERQALLEQPEQVRVAVAKRFRQATAVPADQSLPLTHDVSSPVELAIAAALLHTNDEARSLLEELYAMTVGPIVRPQIPRSLFDDAAIYFDTPSGTMSAQNEDYSILENIFSLEYHSKGTMDEESKIGQRREFTISSVLLKCVVNLLAELRAAKADVVASRTDLTDAHRKLDEAQGELGSLRADLVAKDSSLVRLISDINGLREDLRAARVQAEADAKILCQTRSERDEYKEMLATTSSALDEVRVEAQTCSKRIQLADEIISLLLAEGRELLGEADEVARNRAHDVGRLESSLRDERERASQAQSMLDEENNRLREALFDAEVLALVLGHRERHLKEEISQLLARHMKEQSYNDRMLREARDEVRILRSSRSWMVTEPMRFVGRRLRKLSASIE